ncbi:uncharacterized protein JNUCC1_03575 [Lentibacillus sp. JNUCC-1]|uniref:DUF2627 domain-containing protein n=1 Tax=Lentibacillus sp. JNUCC-1 TaxID=2654513 RepID=UPI0012E71F97|nr:DUF2627 domain-containing protein [Lentibacillus sp. JNUCC-1]MUV39691.1 uncharacterized protein [Lentibacillus sp. JNUCC-1]
MARLIAATLLVIPGIIAAFGIKLMRDSLFNEVNPFMINTGLQFIAGLALLVGGIWFIGGFIVYRDRKRQAQKQKRRD